MFTTDQDLHSVFKYLARVLENTDVIVTQFNEHGDAVWQTCKLNTPRRRHMTFFLDYRQNRFFTHLRRGDPKRMLNSEVLSTSSVLYLIL